LLDVAAPCPRGRWTANFVAPLPEEADTSEMRGALRLTKTD
jgi:hypothetical protein